jgi:hypothetical protein
MSLDPSIQSLSLEDRNENQDIAITSLTNVKRLYVIFKKKITLNYFVTKISDDIKDIIGRKIKSTNKPRD